MSSLDSSKPAPARLARGLSLFALTLLVIEFIDELVFGVGEAAWPLIRDDLNLAYWQVGLLLSLPGLVGNAVEPVLGVLADAGRRRALIVGGGVCFAAALLLTGLAPDFVILLVSLVLFNPSSGAFVSLSQATLMDSNPDRHEQLMARWNLAGSVGVALGPLLLGAAALLGLGWRGVFIALAVPAFALTVMIARQPFPRAQSAPAPAPVWAGFRRAVQALTRRDVLRWLVLLEFADFMGDVLLGYLALYLVDVAGATPAQGALAVAVWTIFSLLSDILLVPLLERMRGLAYLRVSALVVFGLYLAFLLAPAFEAKLVVLALLGLCNVGWYPVLKGQLYSSLPGQSGTVIAVNALFGLVSGLIPAALGLLAERFGLPIAMWALILGPLVLLAGLPRHRRKTLDE
jgi:FSR family fosmidomycin resistance protein-like MFS transporter